MTIEEFNKLAKPHLQAIRHHQNELEKIKKARAANYSHLIGRKYNWRRLIRLNNDLHEAQRQIMCVGIEVGNNARVDQIFAEISNGKQTNYRAFPMQHELTRI